MFYKKTIETIYPNDTSVFNEGNGFYLVTGSDGLTWCHYYNNGFWSTLQMDHEMPTEFIALFDEMEKDVPEKEILVDGKINVTEGFILKAIAIGRANGNNIKVNELLKD